MMLMLNPVHNQELYPNISSKSDQAQILVHSQALAAEGREAAAQRSYLSFALRPFYSSFAATIQILTSSGILTVHSDTSVSISQC